MVSTRKAIFDALYARLGTVQGVTTLGRRLRSFDEVQPSEQPALFMQPGSQVAENTPGLPVKWRLAVDLYLYVHDTTAAGPSELLQELLDRIEAALRATSAEAHGEDAPTTLGGLVLACQIAGPIESDEGSLGAQAVAIVPLELLVS